MPLLSVFNLLKGYRTPDGRRHVVVDVPSFEIAAAAQVALHGASGCGKTTFLNLLAGILQADAGRVMLDGREMTALSEAQRDHLRAEAVGYVFQTFNLLQGYTAVENIELAMRFGRGVDQAFARRLLERVGLEDRTHYRPRQLSVGQQQRVAVARALANRPRLVLADEPTGNLDPRLAAEAVALLRELCRENGAALLLVSHDRDVLSQFETTIEFSEVNRALKSRTETEAA